MSLIQENNNDYSKFWDIVPTPQVRLREIGYLASKLDFWTLKTDSCQLDSKLIYFIQTNKQSIDIVNLK